MHAQHAFIWAKLASTFEATSKLHLWIELIGLALIQMAWEQSCFGDGLHDIFWNALHIHIWCKLKLTRRPPCFVVEIFLVDGVRDTTFKVPINMKIYICKIQDEAVIIISKNKSQNDFLTPCTMRQHGGWKLYKKYDVSLNWNCSANKRSTVKILDIFRICRHR